jgi:hypothetical protein
MDTDERGNTDEPRKGTMNTDQAKAFESVFIRF